MKRFLSLFLMVLMLLSTVLGLAACGEMVDSGAVINAYYVGEMYEFDPARADNDDDAMRVLSLLYEPLFRLTENGKVQPALAESYEILRNEKEGDYKMRIVLKPTTWSDGNVVTAYDVVFAWKRILDPSFQSQAAPLLYEIENAWEAKTAQIDADTQKPITTEDFGAMAVNATTIEITFRQVFDEDGIAIEPNYDAFLRNLTSVSLAPVRQSVVEGDRGAAADYWGKRSITIVTNGPFTISTLDFDLGEFTIERNRYYRYANRDAVGDDRADEMVTPFRIVTDWSLQTSELADKFASESLFIMSELPLDLRAEMADDMVVTDALSTMSILLNLNGYDDSDDRGTALSYASIRKALSEVLDRNAIADKLVCATPASGFISNGVYNADNRRDSFREVGGALISATAKSADVLAADDTQFATDFYGLKSDQRILTLAYNDREADKAVAEYIKTAWESLGFTVELVPLSYTKEKIEVAGMDKPQVFNFRSSQLVDAVEDFAIKKDPEMFPKYDGKASTYLAAYRDGTGIPVLKNNRADLREVYFDAVLVDYQMLAPDAFGALAGFSTNMNGYGVDLSNDENDEQMLTPYKHVTGFANEEYDAKIEAAYNERDLEKRAELLHDAEEILLRELPVIPLTFGQNHYVISRKVRNVDMDYYGNPIFTKTRLKNYKKYLPVEEEEG